ncbi:MAG: M23 family metallopeptidase [Deltaproteobacteria bacterium]|nr:M23 family metallopeptidase [Deltaproteobacteria bacterium]
MTWIQVVGQALAGVLLLTGSVAGALRIETTPSRPSPGQLFWVTVAGAATHGSLELRLGARAFALWADGRAGWEGFAVLDRDESAASREFFVVDTFPAGEQLVGVGEIGVEPRDYGSQEVKVDESMVTLSPSDQERADRENALIRSVLATRSPERLWSAAFVVPTPGEITGPFGVRRIYNGKPKGYHNGVDIAAARGAPVTASAAGRVALVGDYFYTGNTVLVDHGLGLYTAYFHMDSAAVVEGERVETGTILGLVGSTGRSTGPHLHWGVYLSGARADPGSLLGLTRGVVAAARPSPASQPVQAAEN